MTLSVKAMTESQKFESHEDYILTLPYRPFLLSFFLASSAWGQDGFIFGPEIICRHLDLGSRTLCPKLTHLHLGYRSDFDEGPHWRLIYDPLHPQKATWNDTKSLEVQYLPEHHSWLSDYALRFSLGSAMELSFENWSGTTLLPDASGISFSRALQDTSWDQSAARLTWVNPDLRIFAMSFVLGLGEGERFSETDSKPYYGFLARTELAPALSMQGGWSYDSDFLSSDALPWVEHLERQRASHGFSAERQSLALFLDGSYPKARGLRLSAGWQRTRIHGPAADTGVSPRATSPVSLALDPTEVIAEALGARSDLTRETQSLSASYLILGSYVLAFHKQIFQAKLHGSGMFSSCSALDADGLCAGPAQPQSSLRVNALGYGIGRMKEDSWTLMLESFQEQYDKLYQVYHFAPGRNDRQKDLRVLQIRFVGSL